MTATVARLILAPVVIVATATLFFPVFFFIENTILRRDSRALLATDIVCAAFLVVAWLLVWRGEVAGPAQGLR